MATKGDVLEKLRATTQRASMMNLERKIRDNSFLFDTENYTREVLLNVLVVANVCLGAFLLGWFLSTREGASSAYKKFKKPFFAMRRASWLAHWQSLAALVVSAGTACVMVQPGFDNGYVIMGYTAYIFANAIFSVSFFWLRELTFALFAGFLMQGATILLTVLYAESLYISFQAITAGTLLTFYTVATTAMMFYHNEMKDALRQTVKEMGMDGGALGGLAKTSSGTGLKRKKVPGQRQKI